jgi:sugar phosphate isomerase/epimerase
VVLLRLRPQLPPSKRPDGMARKQGVPAPQYQRTMNLKVNQAMMSQTHTQPLFPDSRLLLSAGTLVKASFSERVRAAREAGFDAISLFPQQYLAARRKEKLGVGDMREILAEHDVSLDEVDPLLDWFGPRASPSESLMMEMAEGLGARSINVATAFVSDRSQEEICDCFGQVCERVAQYGLRADLEFLPWTGVNTLTSALNILAAVNQPNAGVMFDLWHFFNSGEQLDVLRNLEPHQAARITSLQLNDAPDSIADLRLAKKWLYLKDMLHNAADSIRVLGFDAFRNVAASARYPHPQANKMMKDALCSRMFPGHGSQPVTEVLSILAEKGVRPAIGVEVFNLEHYARSASELAAVAMQGYRQVCIHQTSSGPV